jgi:hypothetical protein
MLETKKKREGNNEEDKVRQLKEMKKHEKMK